MGFGRIPFIIGSEGSFMFVMGQQDSTKGNKAIFYSVLVSYPLGVCSVRCLFSYFLPSILIHELFANFPPSSAASYYLVFFFCRLYFEIEIGYQCSCFVISLLYSTSPYFVYCFLFLLQYFSALL